MAPARQRPPACQASQCALQRNTYVCRYKSTFQGWLTGSGIRGFVRGPPPTDPPVGPSVASGVESSSSPARQSLASAWSHWLGRGSGIRSKDLTVRLSLLTRGEDPAAPREPHSVEAPKGVSSRPLQPNPPLRRRRTRAKPPPPRDVVEVLHFPPPSPKIRNGRPFDDCH